MTREQIIKHWDVINAFKEGQDIEWYDTCNRYWVCVKHPSFDIREKYRVKPEPIFKEGESVWVKITDQDDWIPANFAYKNKDDHPYKAYVSYMICGHFTTELGGFKKCKKWDEFPNN